MLTTTLLPLVHHTFSPHLPRKAYLRLNLPRRNKEAFCKKNLPRAYKGLLTR